MVVARLYLHSESGEILNVQFFSRNSKMVVARSVKSYQWAADVLRILMSSAFEITSHPLFSFFVALAFEIT